jgi:hypothetical protein
MHLCLIEVGNDLTWDRIDLLSEVSVSRDDCEEPWNLRRARSAYAIVGFQVVPLVAMALRLPA